MSPKQLEQKLSALMSDIQETQDLIRQLLSDDTQTVTGASSTGDSEWVLVEDWHTLKVGDTVKFSQQITIGSDILDAEKEYQIDAVESSDYRGRLPYRVALGDDWVWPDFDPRGYDGEDTTNTFGRLYVKR